MRVFGEATDLSSDTRDRIKIFLENIASSSNANSAYLCFPIFEMNNEKYIFKLLLIASTGIFVVHESEDERKRICRQVKKVITESEAIYDIHETYGDKIITDVSISDLQSVIEKINGGTTFFSEDNIVELNAIIQKSFSLTKVDSREITIVDSLGKRIKDRNNKIYSFDVTQFNAIIKKDERHMRIRGLAGSGKTVILVQKMAWLHYQFPDLNLVYVFNTKSLKQYVERLFRDYYRNFDKYKEPLVGDKVKILHGWGGGQVPGFYSIACKEAGHRQMTYGDAYNRNSLSDVCNDLIENLTGRKLELYDRIFIDEAQDFPLEFFNLAKNTLKVGGKISYAYDEIQNLFGSSMPNPKLVLDNEEYDDVNLDICYRTPKEILVSAHAIGLGIYNDKRDTDGRIELSNMIEDLKVWEAVGYSVVSGKLEYGADVVLQRKKDPSSSGQGEVVFKQVQDGKICVEVAQEIISLVKNENIIADDILIVDLDSVNLAANGEIFKQAFVAVRNEHPSCSDLSVHTVDRDNPLKFRFDNSIPYTTVYRAKGNEASIVILLNADKLLDTQRSFARNILFTAMTRSKYRVYLYGGNNIQKYEREYGIVKEKGYTLEFKYPTLSELMKIKSIAKTESQEMRDYEEAVKHAKKITNKELRIKLIMEQAGVSSIDELKDLLSRGSETDEE